MMPDRDTVRISQFTLDDVARHRGDLARVHALAYGSGESGRVRYAETSLSEMEAFTDFLASVARIGESILGFACGHSSSEHRPWASRVYDHLHAAGLDEWTADPFEFADIAVLPAWQGRGIGRMLLDDVMSRVGQCDERSSSRFMAIIQPSDSICAPDG